MQCKNRQGMIVIEENAQDGFLKFLYGNIAGRLLLKLLTQPQISKIAGKALDSSLSVFLVKPFIKANNIDMSDYNIRKYSSYNDFFTRELKDGARDFTYDDNSLVSPADGRLSVYKIDENAVFDIKNSSYTVESILKSKKTAKEYINGYVIIVRLCVDNYHRYSYPANGVIKAHKRIDGVLHTVNPEVLQYVNIYKENTRECTILSTKDFDDIIQIEVGALMVGRIKNHHSKSYKFSVNEEKGLFEFGGSTVVLLVKDGKVVIDDALIQNSLDGFETVVKIGETIGKKPL